MSKTSSAIIVASLSAMAHQAHAAKAISADESLVDKDMVSELTGALIEKEPHDLIGKSFADFARQIQVNGDGLGIDVELVLSQFHDSTTNVGNGNVAAGCYSNCYSNCHSACHGSRGWR